ncbi:MAG: hypothetical protein WCT24_03940 [Patescibacteria group bacterium]|jgi:hypothetical protein
MAEQINHSNAPPRNPFVALCDYASKNNWCWKITCTTCGHSAFWISFTKLILGQHPDDDSFWPFGRLSDKQHNDKKEYMNFTLNKKADLQDQIKLASIVSESKLSNIQAVTKFPDWLGYVGLVMYHCPSQEARKIITDAFLPEFINLVKDNGELYKYYQDKQYKQELLELKDLERIENLDNETR